MGREEEEVKNPRQYQVSVRGKTYEAVRDAAKARGVSVARLVEEVLRPVLGRDVRSEQPG
jgi:hypothetical protein